MSIFGINAIKDKATRDAIIALSQGAGGGGSGSGSVTVQADDPSADQPGFEGDIIYSENTDSIWVFNGTMWDRPLGGNGIYVQTRIRYVGADDSYSTWSPAPQNFRNQMNHIGQVALVATIIENGEARSDEEHDNSVNSYQWYRNGAIFQPVAVSPPSFTGPQMRAVVIEHGDVSDFGDAFTCEIDYD